MSKIEEICTVSFVDHEAASDLLREFTGKEGGLATVDWYLLRNRIADAISMTRIDEREKCRQLLSEAETREKEARAKALNHAAVVAYATCAETRHVTLGDKVAAAIRALQSEER